MPEFKSETIGGASAQGRSITVAEANLIQVEWIVWARNEIDQARQIIADLVEFCEQPEIIEATDGAFDPGAVIQSAKGFLGGDNESA